MLDRIWGHYAPLLLGWGLTDGLTKIKLGQGLTVGLTKIKLGWEQTTHIITLDFQLKFITLTGDTNFHHIYGGGKHRPVNLVVLLVNGGLGLWCRKIHHPTVCHRSGLYPPAVIFRIILAMVTSSSLAPACTGPSDHQTTIEKYR